MVKQTRFSFIVFLISKVTAGGLLRSAMDMKPMDGV